MTVADHVLAAQVGSTQRGAHVRAVVIQRVVPATHVEHADLALGNAKRATSPLGDLPHFGYRDECPRIDVHVFHRRFTDF